MFKHIQIYHKDFLLKGLPEAPQPPTLGYLGTLGHRHSLSTYHMNLAVLPSGHWYGLKRKMATTAVLSTIKQNSGEYANHGTAIVVASAVVVTASVPRLLELMRVVKSGGACSIASSTTGVK